MKNEARVYLDNAATTKIRPEALDVMRLAMSEEYGNPSSVHKEGRSARKALEEARDSIASLLYCDPTELYFTSGGTESNNWAIRGGARPGSHIIASSIEHPSVLQVCKEKEKEGCHVTYLPVDRYGSVSPETLEKAITPDTSLVSVMMANNEIGTIEPIIQLCRIAHEHGALFHSDCVQAVASISYGFNELDIDLMSFSAHKFYGPKGIGGLCIKKGVKIPSFILGGSQEYHLRAGTVNVPSILGMAEALRLTRQELSGNTAKISDLRLLLVHELKKVCPQVIFHGNDSSSHPGIVNLYVPGMDGEKTLLLLDYHGFACSAGPACSSKDNSVSHVLKAIGTTEKEARNSLRISIGKDNTEDEIRSFVKTFSGILEARSS